MGAFKGTLGEFIVVVIDTADSSKIILVDTK